MNPLFHESAIVATLGSGSRGNCTYVGDGRAGVLVDCGLSTRQIFKRLDAIGLGDTRIDAVLITHEHADHVGAARILDKTLRKRQGAPVPFHMTRGTASGLHDRCVPAHITRVVAGQTFAVGSRGWTVEPVTVPHDTHDPVAYTIVVGGVRVGIVTDLGRSTRLVERQLASLDLAVLEFNHDLTMLLDGAYPWSLKQRVRGPHGHLSNAQAAELLQRAAPARLRHLVLAHLSEDNNLPELALRSAHEALHAAGCGAARVHVASQGEPLSPVEVAQPPSPPVAAPERGRAGTGGRSRVGTRSAEAPRADDTARQIPLF